MKNFISWARQQFFTKLDFFNGALDTRYFTEAELTGGQLDSRYYTEAELNAGQLDTRYYTETELNAGQLDTRYYTETELNNGQLDSQYHRTDEEIVATGATTETARAVDNVRIGTLAGTPRIIFEEGGVAQWELDTSAGLFRIFVPGSVKVTVNSSGNMVLAGTIATANNVAWNLGGYTAGSKTPTGYITVVVAGNTYYIPAEEA